MFDIKLYMFVIKIGFFIHWAHSIFLDMIYEHDIRDLKSFLSD